MRVTGRASCEILKTSTTRAARPRHPPGLLILNLRRLLIAIFTPSPRERRLRGWARRYNMELLVTGFDEYALSCGIFRWPHRGGADLERIENYLWGLQHGLMLPWR